MDAVEFSRLQTALVWVFGDVIQWLGTIAIAGGFIAGVLIIWMGLLRHLTNKK